MMTVNHYLLFEKGERAKTSRLLASFFLTYFSTDEENYLIKESSSFSCF